MKSAASQPLNALSASPPSPTTQQMVEPCSKVNAEMPQRGSEAGGLQRETPRYLREG